MNFQDLLNTFGNPDYKKKYNEYINSGSWREKRDKIMLRDNYTCKECGGEANEVHHLTYDRLCNELDEDLVALCRACHKDKHKSMALTLSDLEKLIEENEEYGKKVQKRE